jgi:hypothetical protein
MFDLDRLVGDYINKHNGWPVLTRSAGRGPWEAEQLHATDLMACPRAVAMRLRGDKAEPFPSQKVRQFWAANQQHELIYAALKDADLLVDCEVPVPMPNGWSGTADMILKSFHNQIRGRGGKTEDRFHVADSKNPHPNMVKYYDGYPKPDDIFQVSVYTRYLHGAPHTLENEGEVFYMPLGGAGEYKPTRFPLVPWTEIDARVRFFNEVRDNLPAIPDPLEFEVRWPKRGEPFGNRRMNRGMAGGDIVLGTSWRCSYCNYQCPNRDHQAQRVVKVSTAGGEYTMTWSKGMEKYTDAVERLLEESAK